MKNFAAAVVITLAFLIGVPTLVFGVQLAFDVAAHPNEGVISDAIGLLPLFAMPVVVVVLLVVVGRGLIVRK